MAGSDAVTEEVFYFARERLSPDFGAGRDRPGGYSYGARLDPQHDLIADFLRRHPGELCVDCLADAIDLPPSQVSMATQRLTFGGAFAARLGVCSRCHHRRTVVKAA